MKRFLIIDKYNTAYDWGLLLTAKTVGDPEVKTNYIELDGASGSIDLTEALTGDVPYTDRTLAASFSMSDGTVQERGAVLQDIRAALHGRKVRIVEPDDPEHFLLGRVLIRGSTNTHSLSTLDIEAVCDPWRYAVNESERRVEPKGHTDVVICNAGTKTVTPVITVSGTVNVTFNGLTTTLTDGSYTVSDIRLKPGANVIGVAGTGVVVFKYREAVV